LHVETALRLDSDVSNVNVISSYIELKDPMTVRQGGVLVGHQIFHPVGNRKSLTFQPLKRIYRGGRLRAVFPFSSEIIMDCHPRRGLAVNTDRQALESQTSDRVRSWTAFR